MAEERVERKLAAIFAADVAGYSRLMGEDEEGTLATLIAHRTELIEPCIAEHRGRVVKTTGDGVLAEFASVVDAVRCAVAFQDGLRARNAELAEDRRINFRIGVNLGDVIVQGDDVYGDGVNVAARLEGLADPGGIVVSGTVHEHVRGKLDLDFEDLGPREFKNIALPVRAFVIALPIAAPEPAENTDVASLPLPDKPSIAVLPFANMSGDPEQEYFADGMVEDIITGLARFRLFFVIARNSSFTYKGRNVDVRQVGRELGVRYVLEGSVRRGSNRLRITAQLVEASTGNHIWAERYDGALEDVFDLQDRITEAIVGAIEPSVRQAEIERARRKKPDSLDAYELYLRAFSLYSADESANAEAVALLDRALSIDPSYAAAHGLAALCHMFRFLRFGFDPLERTTAIKHARNLLASRTDDANALAFSGLVIAVLEHDLSSALSAVERAVALSPNSARSHANNAYVRMLAGQDDAAFEAAQHSIRLSPFDPLNFSPETTLSIVHFRKGRFKDSLLAAERALQTNAHFISALIMQIANYVRLGCLADAQDALGRMLESTPKFRIESLQDIFSDEATQEAVVSALYDAGLPE